MKTTHLIRLAAFAGFFGLTAHAAPFLAINDNSEVFLTAAVGIKSDSNIFLTNNATSDTITNLDVGAELKFGQQSTANGVLSIVDSFNNFSSHSRLNSNLATLRGTTNYDDGKLKLNLNGSYVETDDNQFDTVNQDFRVRRNVLSLGANAEVAATQKTSFGGGFEFGRTDYRRTGYSDQNMFTVPFNYYYQVTPKVDLSLGYRYRDTKVSLGQNSEDNFYNIGARGQFTPKLSGRFALGLNRRELQNGSSENQLGITSDFSYVFSPKTNVQFGVTNDFGTTGQGQQQKTLAFTLGVQNSLSEQWRVGLNLSHRTIEYATKTDHYLEGQLSTSYIVNVNCTVTAAYAHRNNESGAIAGVGAFTGNVFSLGASFRY